MRSFKQFAQNAWFVMAFLSLPAQAVTLQLRAALDGAQVPAASAQTGLGVVTFDTVSKQLAWNVTFSGLTGSFTDAHFHGPAAAGVNAGVVVPMPGTTSPLTGSATLNATQEGQLLAGQWYINIHSSTFPNGEIRGQVMPVRRDFNGNGTADILWRNASTGDNAIWLMNGFTIASSALITSVADASWKVAGVGDFDADGKADILWRNASTGDTAIWLMNGVSLTASAIIGTVPGDWSIVGVGDYDGNGKADILWRNAGTGDNAIWLMNGTALASAAFIPSVAPGAWTVVGSGDHNGDGKADILWRNTSTGDNAIWFMNGSTLASSAFITSVVSPAWIVAGVADYNGDGTSDILWRNAVTGDNALWLMNGATLSSSALLGSVPTNWRIVAVGDYDGNGRADILWRDGNGQLGMWLMNGFTVASSAFLATVPTSWGVAPAVSAALSVVRFAALGATGKGNQGQLDVAAAIKAKCAASGCDFIQLLGNNIYDNGVNSTADPQWATKFETPYAEINLPFFAVLGNHDYGGNGTGNEFNKGQIQVDYTAVSPSQKWKMPAKHYNRRVKHVEFFALDSNLQMYAMDAAQRTDVAGWLAASTATWKIALGLHSYRSNGPHGNAGTYDGAPFLPIANGAGVKSFMDQIVCGMVDLHLSAHDHSLQWPQQTCAGTELIVSGAGASLTTLPGTQATHFQSLQLGFVYVVIEGNTLTAEFIDTTGAVLFTRSITKP